MSLGNQARSGRLNTTDATCWLHYEARAARYCSRTPVKTGRELCCVRPPVAAAVSSFLVRFRREDGAWLESENGDGNSTSLEARCLSILRFDANAPSTSRKSRRRQRAGS